MALSDPRAITAKTPQPEDTAAAGNLSEVRRRLEGDLAALRDANPGLYRDLALYLQVLRELLPGAVEKALFHIATRFLPQRYCELPAERRSRLQRSTATLVRDAGSLLTVEQLSHLAAELASDRHQRRRQWLADLRAAGDEPEPPEADGSVHLSLEPPIGPGWLGERPAPPLSRQDAAPTALDPQERTQPVEPPGELPVDPQLGPWPSAQLPTEPQALLSWLEGFERALVRRLLHLSHALNAELLRAGLSQSLLPLNLLDAALQGEVEHQAAPANLLRLALPVPDPLPGSLEAVAVLLRTADLELEHPRLRSCRGRLQRHRQEVRRMAEQHRRLRRRLQALEAERLWHQDNPRSPQGNSFPP